MTRPLSGIPLDRPLHVADIARALGMSAQKARRFLLALDEAHPGLLLRRPGPRTHYMVTLRALRQVMPRIGLEGDGDALVNLDERVRTLESRLKRLQSPLAYTRPRRVTDGR